MKIKLLFVILLTLTCTSCGTVSVAELEEDFHKAILKAQENCPPEYLKEAYEEYSQYVWESGDEELINNFITYVEQEYDRWKSLCRQDNDLSYSAPQR